MERSSGLIIAASEGKYLTQNKCKEQERVFVKEAFLYCEKCKENWREADAAEKEAYDKAERERMSNGE